MDSIDIFRGICYAIVIFLLMAMGWVANEAYKDYTNKQTLNGLWFGNRNWSYTEVEQTANKLDSSGQWVLININNKMSYEEIISVCIHESSHELFARKCTKNIDKCMELIANEEIT